MRLEAFQLNDKIEMAERHVATGAKCLARQVASIERIQMAGGSTAIARRALDAFLALQATFWEHLDQLKQIKDAAESAASPSPS